MFNLTLATAGLGVLILLKGFGVLARKGKYLEAKKKLLYNRTAGVLLWSLAVAWTLWEVTKLGPADFGNFKNVLFAIFLALGISSVWMLKDYLMVRAACVVWLFISWWLLKAAYFEPVWTKVFFVTSVYVTIVGALYFAVAPWRARDIMDAMIKKPKLRRTMGWVYVAWGMGLLAAAVSYRFV